VGDGVGTFLTTRKMGAALAARIEHSVSGSRAGSGPQRIAAHTRKLLFRLGCAFAAAALTVGAVALRVRHLRAIESARATLIQVVRTESAALSKEDRAFMSRVQPWLTRLAGSYEGDLVADELRSPASLEATLARRSVYVRGPLAAFSDPARLPEVAAASTVDALVRCMFDPPSTRTEHAVLSKARAPDWPSKLAAPPGRLHDATTALQLVALPWEPRIRAAGALRDLERLKGELDRLTIASARRPTRAELLFAAMDEPGYAGPADLDGERAHAVRVTLTDLRAGHVLMRLRKYVDPAWLSDATRATSAGAADACALAYDMRAHMVRAP
jgi:hypothetical protein